MSRSTWQRLVDWYLTPGRFRMPWRVQNAVHLLASGDRLGDYRLIRKLGSGGMGSVYEARHTRIGHHVALKVLHPYLSHDEDMVKRLLQEARTSNLVRHPGIVQITDHHRQRDGTTYLVMEFLEGETLRARLRRGTPLSPSEILSIGEQLAAALAAAHAQGVIHRDLKPENVMLSADGKRVKILDFGLAFAASFGSHHLTLDGHRIGTPAYMAPEQCVGERAVAASDVYALGAVLYELCAGRPPFVSEDQGALYGLHRFEEPRHICELSPQTPEQLAQLIHEMLAKLPAGRPTMLEGCEALHALGAPVSPTELVASSFAQPPIDGALGVALSEFGVDGSQHSLRTAGQLPRWRRWAPWAVGAAVAGVSVWFVRNDVTVAHHIHYRAVSRAVAEVVRDRAPTVPPIGRKLSSEFYCAWFQRFQGGKLLYTLGGISGIPASRHGRTFFILSTEPTAGGPRWAMLQRTNYQSIRDLDLFRQAVTQGRATPQELGFPRPFAPLPDIERYFRGYNGFGDINQPAVAGSIARLYALKGLDTILGKPMDQECATTVLIETYSNTLIIGGAPSSHCVESHGVYVLHTEFAQLDVSRGAWEQQDREPLWSDRFHKNCLPPSIDVSLGALWRGRTQR